MRDPLGVEILDVVTAKALGSNNYKKQLLADPVKVLKAEGLKIPRGVTVEILQNTEKKVYFVLPSQLPTTIDLGEVNILMVARHTGGT
jgi:hypothetical protein